MQNLLNILTLLSLYVKPYLPIIVNGSTYIIIITCNVTFDHRILGRILLELKKVCNYIEIYALLINNSHM